MALAGFGMFFQSKINLIQEALSLGCMAGAMLSPHSIAAVKYWKMNTRQAIQFLNSGLIADIFITIIVYIMYRPFSLFLNTYQIYIHILYLSWLFYFICKNYFNLKKNDIEVKFNSSRFDGFYLQVLNPNPWFFWTNMVLKYKNENYFYFSIIFISLLYVAKTISTKVYAHVGQKPILRILPLIYTISLIKITLLK